MKKIILYLSIALIISSILSCEDTLDALPEDKISQDTFWQEPGNVRGFIADIYSRVFPTTYELHPCFDEAMSDNSYMVWDGWYTNIKLVANGTQDAYGSVPDNIWKYSYEHIRFAWQFLENKDKIVGMSESEVASLTGQVRFLMAFAYMRLTFYFGDVPLVEKVLTVEESKIVTRTPKAEVVSFIHAQLDLATQELQGKTLERGRITSDACQVLKARVYLLNNDYQNILNVTTNLIGKYALHTEGDTPYADLFNGEAESANEIILSRQFAHSSGSVSTGNRLNQTFFLKGMSGGDAFRAITPTGSLVDAYPMADGRLIHESGSTYKVSDPYKDRDPRLAQSIIYPTSTIRAITSNGIDWVPYDPEDAATIPEQQYNAKEPSPTGYAWKKYCDWSDHAMVQILDCGNDLIILRYADVLLMHAEALAETKGTAAKNEIINIINQLRDRCKGGRVHDQNYNSQEELRLLVRNERRVELANEGLRYYDIIRWKIAENTPSVDGYGMKGELYGAYMRLDGIGSNDRTVMVDGAPRRYVETRIFNPEKHYLQPIPQKDIDLTNGTLTQNPNW